MTKPLNAWHYIVIENYTVWIDGVKKRKLLPQVKHAIKGMQDARGYIHLVDNRCEYYKDSEMKSILDFNATH